MTHDDTHGGQDGLMAGFVEQLLDSYFTFRDSLPQAGFIQENKTTRQIQDELQAMYGVTADEVVEYMLSHGFGTTTEQDGTVCWAIFRQVGT
jgi:hypothetical protein